MRVRWEKGFERVYMTLGRSDAPQLTMLPRSLQTPQQNWDFPQTPQYSPVSSAEQAEQEVIEIGL